MVLCGLVEHSRHLLSSRTVRPLRCLPMAAPVRADHGLKIWTSQMSSCLRHCEHRGLPWSHCLHGASTSTAAPWTSVHVHVARARAAHLALSPHTRGACASCMGHWSRRHWDRVTGMTVLSAVAVLCFMMGGSVRAEMADEFCTRLS